jgi:hypothetical protein
MSPEAILQALTHGAADLPFGGPFDLAPVKDNVYRLSAGARAFLLKWIQGESVHDEVRANRDGLRGDPIAPPIVATLEEGGGTIACWEWLEGADLREPQRHLLPRAFGELGAFHLRRRHDGPVVSPRSRLEHASVAEFVAAERLDNRTRAAIDVTARPVTLAPVGIYQLDGLVRRAPSLQGTTDGREGAAA